MFPIMLVLVTPSYSIRLPEELRVIHAVSAALVTYSIQAVDMLLQKNWVDIPLLSGSQAVISRTLRKSIHHHSLSSSVTCSQLCSPALNSHVLSDVQQNCYLTYLCSYLSCCSVPELQKSATTAHHTKNSLSPIRDMFLFLFSFCSTLKSQGSSELQIPQEPKLTNSTAHTACRQHALQGVKSVKCLQRKVNKASSLAAEDCPSHRPND